MALARNFKQTVVERVERDPQFAMALLDEAATLFLSGEPETARIILRDLVNATFGFEQLAEITEKPSKSLHRMLSPRETRAWTTLLRFSVPCNTASTLPSMFIPSKRCNRNRVDA